jgi:hypothetical protein
VGAAASSTTETRNKARYPRSASSFHCSEGIAMYERRTYTEGGATFDRTGCALGLACVGVVLVVALLGYSNAIGRLQVRLSPAGTPVPVTELSPDGLPAGGDAVVLAASTSLDTLRQAVRADRTCPGPPASAPRACWRAVRGSSGMLLLAAVPEGCGNREWHGWMTGTALTIQLVTWGCLLLRAPETGPEASYALLGVPLDRLPHGRLQVRLADTGASPVQVNVP